MSIIRRIAISLGGIGAAALLGFAAPQVASADEGVRTADFRVTDGNGGVQLARWGGGGSRGGGRGFAGRGFAGRGYAGRGSVGGGRGYVARGWAQPWHREWRPRYVAPAPYAYPYYR